MTQSKTKAELNPLTYSSNLPQDTLNYCHDVLRLLAVLIADNNNLNLGGDSQNGLCTVLDWVADGIQHANNLLDAEGKKTREVANG